MVSRTQEEDKILVLSKDAIECKAFDDNKSNVKWESCSLKQWLQEDFANECFKNCSPKVSLGKEMFLLSKEEVETYLQNTEYGKCEPLNKEEAKKIGYRKEDSENNQCWWWLRDSGAIEDTAKIVLCDGTILEDGHNVHYEDAFVRPAIWCDKNIFEFN